jgi:hypothetical protein
MKMAWVLFFLKKYYLFKKNSYNKTDKGNLKFPAMGKVVRKAMVLGAIPRARL